MAFGLKRTLMDRLSPVIDRCRQIPSTLGVRPYRIFLVTTRWSGGDYGEGMESVVSEREIVPPPKLYMDVGIDFKPFGADHTGGATLDGVSLSYSEYDLYPDTPAKGGEFFYEVRGRDDTNRMRFFPSKKPVKNHPKHGIGWVLELASQDMHRTDDGRLDNDGPHVAVPVGP